MQEGYQPESIRRLSRLRRVKYQYSRGHHPSHPYLKLDCQNITNHQLLHDLVTVTLHQVPSYLPPLEAATRTTLSPLAPR